MKAGIVKRGFLALSLLWILVAGVVAVNDANYEAHRSATSWEDICKNSSDNKHCNKSKDELWAESWIKEGIPVVLIKAFGPVIFIFLIWAIAHLGVRVFFWVRTGKFKRTVDINYFRHTFVSFLTIIILMGIWVAYVSHREKAKERAAAACKLQAIEKGYSVESDERNRYIEACMGTVGYKLRDWSWCYNSAQVASCYE